MRQFVWIMVFGCASLAGFNSVHGAEPADGDKAVRADLEAQLQGGLISPQRLAAKLAMIESQASGSFQPASSPDAPDSPDLIQNGTFGEYNVNTKETQSRWIWWGGWMWSGEYHFQQAKSNNIPCAAIHCTGKAGQAGLFTPLLPVLKPGAHYKATVSARAEGGAVLEMRYKADVEAVGADIQNGAKKFSPESAVGEYTLEGAAKPGAKSFRLYIYNDGPGTLYLDRVTLVEESDQAEKKN